MKEKRKELLRIIGYSEKSIDIIDREINLGALENPTIQLRHAGSCGDVLTLYLRIEDDIIEDASFNFIGCTGLQVCASGMTEMIKGMSVSDAEEVSIERITEYLVSIPDNKFNSLKITRDALQEILARHREEQAEYSGT